jgi:hypothetical protein
MHSSVAVGAFSIGAVKRKVAWVTTVKCTGNLIKNKDTKHELWTFKRNSHLSEFLVCGYVYMPRVSGNTTPEPHTHTYPHAAIDAGKLKYRGKHAIAETLYFFVRTCEVR